ncbi:MAG: phosphatase PAP2-related protein [Patescibacteria group bacterium]
MNRSLFTREYWGMILSGSLLLALALVANFYAGTYATSRGGMYVDDLILDILPVFDVSLVFVYGTLFFWAVLGLVLLRRPKEVPFFLKALSLFIVVRSLFITLTHLGPVPHLPIRDPYNLVVSTFTFGGDLFFSGHTGIPFLMALMYWKESLLRYLFLFSSLGFGATVLLGHLHYSIDVFAAFFITYGIHEMAKRFFPAEYDLFRTSLTKPIDLGN